MTPLEASYQRLFELHPQPMWVFDAESLVFLAVNDAAVSEYGFTRAEFLTMTIADIRPAEDGPTLRDAVRDASRGLVFAGMWRHRRRDGSMIDVRITSNAVQFEGRSARVVLAEDITTQARLEQELRRARKMEAIGNQAGAMAHDFNNILLVIRSHVAALVEVLERARASVEQIEHAGGRANGLTHQLLAFIREEVIEPDVVDVNEVIVEMTQLLEPTLGGDVVVELRLQSEPARIMVDRAQLAQAIMNLVVNADQAMADGGSLLIRTDTVQLDEKDAPAREGFAASPHVLLQVTDSGSGMDAPTLARVFEPFYTTKDDGTGLGLATIIALVKESNGSVSAYSEPTSGSTFKLYFPAIGDMTR
jgi:PAS domain S-box-containing protein